MGEVNSCVACPAPSAEAPDAEAYKVPEKDTPAAAISEVEDLMFPDLHDSAADELPAGVQGGTGGGIPDADGKVTSSTSAPLPGSTEATSSTPTHTGKRLRIDSDAEEITDFASPEKKRESPAGLLSPPDRLLSVSSVPESPAHSYLSPSLMAQGKLRNPQTVQLGESYREFRLRAPGYSKTSKKLPSESPMYEYVSGAVVEVEAQATVGSHIDLGPAGRSDLGLPEFLIMQVRLPSEGGGIGASIRKSVFSFGRKTGSRRITGSTDPGREVQRDATPSKHDLRQLSRAERHRSIGFARLYKALRSAARANRASLKPRATQTSPEEVPPTVVLAFRLADQFRENMSCPAIPLFHRFSAATTASEVPLKAIVLLQNPEALPRAFRHLDGKPVLLTNSAKLVKGTTQEGASFLEVHVSMSKWSTFAQESIRQLQPMAPDIEFLLGFTIEGNAEEELPERLLCAAHVSKIDLESTVRLDETEL